PAGRHLAHVGEAEVLEAHRSLRLDRLLARLVGDDADLLRGVAEALKLVDGAPRFTRVAEESNDGSHRILSFFRDLRGPMPRPGPVPTTSVHRAGPASGTALLVRLLAGVRGLPPAGPPRRARGSWPRRVRRAERACASAHGVSGGMRLAPLFGRVWMLETPSRGLAMAANLMEVVSGL